MSLFVIGTDVKYQVVAVAADRLKQLQTLIACGDQTSGHIALVPHNGDRDDVVTMYCNEEAGMIDNAGFNDLGACIIEILGYNVAAFSPLAVRGPLIIAGFTDDEGNDVPLTEDQTKALAAMCDYAKKHGGDLGPRKVHTAKMLGQCLFRGDAQKLILASDAKIKSKKTRAKAGTGAGAGAGAGAGSASETGGGKEENKKA